MTFTYKLSKRLAIAFAALIGTLAGCADHDAAGTGPITIDPPAAVGDTLFADGFEAPSLSWDDNFTPLSKLVTRAAARSGVQGLRVNFGPGTDGGVLSKFVSRGDRIYFRAAIRHSTGWTGATGLLTLRAAPAGNPWAAFGTAGVCPSGTTWATTGVATSGAALDLRFNTYYVGMPRVSPGVCAPNAGLAGPTLATYTPLVTLNRGAWHVVEIEAQLNTVGLANGWQRIWLDGTQVGQWTGLRFRTSSGILWNAVSLELPAAGVTQPQTLDIDDVLVRRQRPASVTAPPPPPPPPPAPTSVASVSVTPGTATLAVGGRAQLTAVARDAAGTVLTGRLTSWTSSASAVATVVGGLVTATGAGQATITATSEGRSGTAVVTVSAPTPPPPPPPPSSGSYPNEPAGAVVVMDYDADFGNAAAGPWDYITGASNLSTVSDPTAPVNPQKVGRVRFNAGCCDGTGPAQLERYPRLPATWSRLYVSDWVKFDASFDPHGCCQKLFEFFWSSGGDKWLIVKADPTNGGFPLVPRFTTEYAGSPTLNLGGQPVILPGVWYQLEVIVHRSGRLQLWIRPVGGTSQLMYDGTPPGGGSVNPSSVFWWWGYGGLGAYPGPTSYIYHNHIRVSYAQ